MDLNLLRKNFLVGAYNVMTMQENTTIVASSTETIPRVKPVDQPGDEDAKKVMKLIMILFVIYRIREGSATRLKSRTGCQKSLNLC